LGETHIVAKRVGKKWRYKMTCTLMVIASRWEARERGKEFLMERGRRMERGNRCEGVD
jgi:hypothetical protein